MAAAPLLIAQELFRQQRKIVQELMRKQRETSDFHRTIELNPTSPPYYTYWLRKYANRGPSNSWTKPDALTTLKAEVLNLFLLETLGRMFEVCLVK